MKRLKVGISGYGIVGKKRRECVDENPHLDLVVVCDEKFVSEGVFDDGVKFYPSYEQIFNEQIDMLFVCMPNNIAPKVVKHALKKSINTFCEKPPGRNLNDISEIIAEEKNSSAKLMYGFNHRYHDSVIKAIDISKSGLLGNIISMRGVYGKSKLITFNQTEWRTIRELAGGGILLDQGIHMVDLMRLFAGNFTDIHSFISNDYWGYDVEDNAYVLMKSDSGIVAMLNSSATQWRHEFKLDITFDKGALILSGILSGSKSYGDERLTVIFSNESDNGNPIEKQYKYNKDLSWSREVDYFVDCILNNKSIRFSTSKEAFQTMKLVEDIYKADKSWNDS